MASVFRFAVLAVCAVALQGAAAEVLVNITIPDFLGGGIYEVETIDGASLGGKIKLDMDVDGSTVSKTIEAGPFGGMQSNLTTPWISNIGNVLVDINTAVDEWRKNIDNVQQNIKNILNNPLKAVQDATKQIQTNISNTINGLLNLEAKIPGVEEFQNILTNLKTEGIESFQTLISNMSNMMNQLVAQGKLTTDELLSIGTSVFASALKQTVNPLALLNDVLNNGVSQSLIKESEALQVLLQNAKNNLQSSSESAVSAVTSVLESAFNNGLITEVNLDELKKLVVDVATNTVSSIQSSIDATTAELKTLASSATETATEAMNSATETATEAMNSATKTATEAMSSATETATEAMNSATEAVTDAAGTAGFSITL